MLQVSPLTLPSPRRGEGSGMGSTVVVFVAFMTTSLGSTFSNEVPGIERPRRRLQRFPHDSMIRG